MNRILFSLFLIAAISEAASAKVQLVNFSVLGHAHGNVMLQTELDSISMLRVRIDTVENRAVQFNGDANHALRVLENAAIDFTDAFTVEAWVRLSSISGRQTIAARDESGAQGQFLLEYDEAVSGIRAYVKSSTTDDDLIASFAPPIDQWFHLAMIWQAGARRLYINGNLAGSNTTGATLQPTDLPLTIGNWTGGNRPLNGALDEVRVWNTARTETQIRVAFGSALLGNEAGLVAYFDMNLTGEGANTIVPNRAASTGAPLNALTLGSSAFPRFILTDFPTLSVEGNSRAKPTAFALAQNYPNPFNPTTVIAYQLPTLGSVKLELFDVLGRKVASLVNARQTQGSYTVNLNASACNLSSGVYFYRLSVDAFGAQSGSFVQTKKMMLLK